MATPAEVVADAFAKAYDYAHESLTQLTTFTDKLSSNLFVPPTVDITWTPIAAPELDDPPVRPAALDSLETEFNWDEDGSIEAAKPAPLSVVDPTVTIDEFTDVAPTLAFPDAPTVTYGAVPTVPTITAPTIPDAPLLDTIALPSLLTITTPTFAGIDLHTAMQTQLDTAPTLAIVEPTAYSYTPGPEYASDLLAALKQKLQDRLAGGTGLDPAAEAALWNRARDREVATAQASIDEATRLAETQGFLLPTGVLAAQLRQAQVTFYDKASGLSRDIAIKQADLEQANLRDTITAGLQLEGKLIDYSFQLENLAFQSAVQAAENAVKIYNGRVDHLRAMVQSYDAYRQAYDSIIRAELAAVDELKAKIALEQAKADFNRAAVETYKAQIEAGQARVKIYEAQVGAAKTLVDLERAKVEAAGEQIKGFIAQVNAETAKVEAYKAGVQAEATKVTAFEAVARAFGEKVRGQAAKAQAELGVFEARIRAKANEWDAWRARVAAETERFRALAAKSSAVIDGYRVESIAYGEQSRVAISRWEAQMKEYEAIQTYTLNGQKINADIFAANRSAILDAAKVGAQTYAQLTSSAWNIVHASAGVSASGSNSVSYSYSNDTQTAPPAVTTI